MVDRRLCQQNSLAVINRMNSAIYCRATEPHHGAEKKPQVECVKAKEGSRPREGGIMSHLHRSQIAPLHIHISQDANKKSTMAKKCKYNLLWRHLRQ